MVMGVYFPRIVSIHLDETVITGLTFVADPRHPQYAGALNDQKIADVIRRGAGKYGRNVDYFFDSLRLFEEFGVSTSRYGRIKAYLKAGR